MRPLVLLFAGLLVLLAAPLRAAGLPDPVTFFVAIERGDIHRARDWLDAGLPPDFEGSMVGSGLMIAAWEGNVPMMELFHARGARLDKTNRLGEQALLHAAWRGHLDAVRWLVERGARVNRQGKEWSALHYAAFAGHGAVVDYLIARGADVNGLSTNGSTPMMMAAREGHEAVAKTLLAAGARRDVVNDNGDNAVSFAMRNKNVVIAREIAGSENFAAVAARPQASWSPPVRSQRVPDRADLLLAQAQKLEAAGMRAAALRTYRAAMDAIRKAETAKTANAGKTAPAAVSGLVITARRGDASAQSAGLSYATPAAGGGDPIGDPPVQGLPATNPAPNVAPNAAPNAATTSPGADGWPRKVGAGDTASAPAAPGSADEWLRRGRELEAAGRRAEALHAYRQASAALRGSR